MNQQWLQKTRQGLQKRIAVWLVLTICFAIINRLMTMPLLKWVTLIGVAYTIILIGLWCYFTIKQLR
ncbi:hypothetical protein FD27_GL001250 [Limosilactobacillus frumenti DSM 13145]|uniref:Uncharacterized protein n=1 Tax=Limosilactobacillus frumenti DSM 13145 TaxID=1423746 RepID=A0A0R1PD20_9LACO|nr:hypothetical protein [Limosilactobacillus frumenti]KRL26571.1 hypothetical protein FD27_GL001250 [Limosilactobacillus frumenti DSM 13145]MBA2914111.1 hypothetical protein [Limosilactobacillus frumenti]QFG72236.1 hypothetical protein LF145_02165 [Limosilactobacillus frumenti]